jgi:hypothetical protein
LKSELCFFHVSEKNRPFAVHTALLPLFPKSISGSPNTTHKKIENVDENIFSCCCEFVYTGDYSLPGPISTASEDAENKSSNDDEPSQKAAEQWTPTHLTRNLFHPSRFPGVCRLILERLDGIIVDKACPNTDPTEDYTNLFLGHAHVYRFGYRTDWASLCALSLYRIANILANFTLFEERTGDVVRLLSFVFEESEYMDNLRHLLRDYAVWNVGILMKDVRFLELLDRAPCLERDIFCSMWKSD